MGQGNGRGLGLGNCRTMSDADLLSDDRCGTRICDWHHQPSGRLLALRLVGALNADVETCVGCGFPYQKVVEVAVRILRRIIEHALTKFPAVQVYMHEGNHDPAGSVWLRVMFAAALREEPASDDWYVAESLHRFRVRRELSGLPPWTPEQEGQVAALIRCEIFGDVGSYDSSRRALRALTQRR